MGKTVSESDTLLTWFQRERRKWWRMNWWKWVLIIMVLGGVALLFPYLQAAFVAKQQGVSLSQVLPQISTGYSISLPLGYLVLLLFSIWQVSRLGTHYSIPNDLLVASSPADCNIAFQRCFRWDVYLVYGLLLMVPELVILIAGFVSGNAISPESGLVLYFLTSLILILELVVWLHVLLRSLHPGIHSLILVLLLILTSYTLPGLILALLKHLTHGVDHEQLAKVVLGFIGILLAILGLRLGHLRKFQSAIETAWIKQ